MSICPCATARGRPSPPDPEGHATTFGESIKTVYTKYATFSGRASRSEFWWYSLFYYAIGLGFDFLLPELGNIWTFANFAPLLAVTARRLHDTNRSGWWQALPLIGLPLAAYGAFDFFNDPLMSMTDLLLNPLFLIGAVIVLGTYILLIVWWATPGTHGANRFGEDPLGRTEADVFD
ncbi:MAG: DUF805 domain-containing protein [Pseudomonadota bacterium]